MSNAAEVGGESWDTDAEGVVGEELFTGSFVLNPFPPIVVARIAAILVTGRFEGGVAKRRRKTLMTYETVSQILRQRKTE